MLVRRCSSAFARPWLSRRPLSTTPSRSTASLSLGSLPLRIGIVGAGPSGFYVATRLLALAGSENTTIDLFDALPVPFGLARFGVAPDHPEVKNCEHKFEDTARDTRVRFFGNVELSSSSATPLSAHSAKIPLSALKSHYDALILSYGSSHSRPLAIPGESLPGSLAARDIVGWYNCHPSLPHPPVDLSNTESVTLIGVGNVSLDIARLLLAPLDALSSTDMPAHVLAALSTSSVRTVRIVGRRGPLQLAATTKEVREMMALPDVHFRADKVALDAAVAVYEVNKGMRGGRGTKRALDVMRKGSVAGPNAGKEWSFEWLRSPLEILPGHSGRVASVRWGVNELVDGGDPADAKVRATGAHEVTETDLVLSSVGYRSAEVDGVPFDSMRGVVRNIEGRVIDVAGLPIKGLYASGWLATGPTGVIATTMYDAYATADRIAQDLVAAPPTDEPKPLAPVEQLARGVKVVSWSEWERIDREERRRGELLGKVREKMGSVVEMLEFVQ